jgi:hypothetical protein
MRPPYHYLHNGRCTITPALGMGTVTKGAYLLEAGQARKSLT